MHLGIPGDEPLHAGRAVLTQLGEEHGPVGGKFSLQVIPLRQFLRRYLQKPVIIGSQHGDVQIVVPGNKPLMPHRPQGRAGKEDIGNIVDTADPVKLRQQLQQNLLMPPEGIAGHRAPSWVKISRTVLKMQRRSIPTDILEMYSIS